MSGCLKPWPGNTLSAESVTKQNANYRESMEELQLRIKRLTMSYEELMATVDMLRNMSKYYKSTNDRCIY